MTSIVVFGPNGATGRVIVEEALRAGHSVTAAVRRPELFMKDEPDDVARPQIARADVRDLESVRSAIAGHDAVVSAIGPAGARAKGLYSAAAHNLVTAMSDHGPRRLVVLSSAGARRDDPHHALVYRILARTVMNELYSDMRAMEDILRTSTLDWTVVRPGQIVDEPAGAYEVLDGLTPKGNPSIPRSDLARFVVSQVDNAEWSHKYPTLTRGSNRG
ncbi:NAD(P)-dependent oxidoreductase [Pseudonocardia sp. KRD291]|uniref:NAD(P)-dependent oxidoreductase n=1 Tax=Pseudonocardia sp. KRD291 TaxID=2792007 RepID=UPI001C4A7315|nr:SDR family oxidoreductase [Pseudonocardia sp. KRD291]MBW0101627.1 SDR family oxidoreductase [Pseudonocardia sp. KRD291]